MRAPAPAHADHLPGPVRLAQSAHDGRRRDRPKPSSIHGLGDRRDRRRARARSCSISCACRDRRAAALSARVLRRPAPAHRHRPRSRAAARASSSATRRSRRSTSPCRPRSSTCCRICSASSASPTCSSRTTSRSSGTSRTAWRSCISAASSRSRRPTTLFAAPAHPYTRALLAAIPAAHPDERRPRLRPLGDLPGTRPRFRRAAASPALPPCRGALPDGRSAARPRRRRPSPPAIASADGSSAPPHLEEPDRAPHPDRRVHAGDLVLQPVPSGYENFRIDSGRGASGPARPQHRDRRRAVGLGGARRCDDRAGLWRAGRQRRACSRPRAGSDCRASSSPPSPSELAGIDGVYVSLHGAMGADGELDPEGYLLAEIRRLAGPAMPIVISLDLHGILTDRMLRADRRARDLPHLPACRLRRHGRAGRELPAASSSTELSGRCMARVVIPALVRGDELITKTGCYGDLIRECRRLERGRHGARRRDHDRQPLHRRAGAVQPGPRRRPTATRRSPRREAMRLAAEFWPQRFRMQGKLIPLDRAIAQARTIEGPVVFTDAADATSSGATGDSNVHPRRLWREAGYPKRVLAQIVDPPAAAAAHAAGVGATIEVSLGGALDPGRFTPMPVEARVKLLSDGRSRLETMRIGARRRPDGGADVRQLHRRGVQPDDQPVRPGDVLRQRARPGGFRPHRRQVAAHRAPHVRRMGREELQHRRARRDLGEPQEPRPHDLRPADVPAGRGRRPSTPRAQVYGPRRTSATLAA